MATKKPMKKFKRYDEGGTIMGEMDPREAAAKQRGLNISNKEAPVSFFERAKAGNIDQPGTEAYNRFGAGRAYAQTMDDENEAMRAANRASSASAMPVARPSMKPNPLITAGIEQGKVKDSGDASVAEYYANKPRNPQAVQDADNPRVSSPASKPTASASKPTVNTVPRLRADPSRGDLGNKPSQYAGPLRGMRSDAGTSPPVATHKGPRDEEKSSSSKIPGQSAKAPQGGEKVDSSETSRNVGNAMNALGATAAIGAGAAGLYKLGKMYDASKKAKQALLKNPRLERPGTVTGKDFVVRDYEGAAKAGSKGAPKKQLGYSKDTDVTDVMAKKRGGAVKKYASGGMVSSASKRADGIASKGKTRCKIC